MDCRAACSWLGTTTVNRMWRLGRANEALLRVVKRSCASLHGPTKRLRGGASSNRANRPVGTLSGTQAHGKRHHLVGEAEDRRQHPVENDQRRIVDPTNDPASFAAPLLRECVEDLHSAPQARIDRPVDKRRASHPLPLPRVPSQGASRVRFHAGPTPPVRVQMLECGPKLVANPEHLALLQQGIDPWNAWRAKRAFCSSRPQRGEPLRGEPQRGEPLRSEPQQGEPQQGEPHLGEPHLGEPQRGEPLRGGPQRGAPRPGQPQRGEPQRREPQRGEPQRGKPRRAKYLSRANLSEANLGDANLSEADLFGETSEGEPQRGGPS